MITDTPYYAGHAHNGKMVEVRQGPNGDVKLSVRRTSSTGKSAKRDTVVLMPAMARALGEALTKVVVTGLLLLAVVALGVGAKERPTTTIKIVRTETRLSRTQPAGIIGLAMGARHQEIVFAADGILPSGEHVKLRCEEHHRQCSPLPTNEDLQAEVDVKNADIWISTRIPFSGKMQRDHWKAIGSW